MEGERRESSRIAVAEAGVRVRSPAALAEAQVVELSAAGLGLVLPPGLWPAFERVTLALELPGHGCLELEARPIRAEPIAGGLRLGLGFALPDPAGLGRMAAFLAERYRQSCQSRDLDQAARARSLGVSRRDLVVRMLSHYLLRMETPLRAYCGLELMPGSLHMRSFETSSARMLLECEADGQLGDRLTPRSEVLLAFPACRALAFFESEVFRAKGSKRWLTMPACIRQTSFRASGRLMLEPSNRTELVIFHPRLPEKRLCKLVLEAGARGLSFPFDPLRDCFFPGERLGRVEVRFPGGLACAEAMVRSMRELDGEVPLACGLELTTFESPEAREAWGRFVFKESYPQLIIAGSEQAENVWDVLVRSQYPEEVIDVLRPSLEHRFFSAWGRTSCDLRQGRVVLIEKQGRPVGTAAANLLYPRTWFFHHMGFDADERRADRLGLFALAHEIYVGMCHLMSHMNSADFWAIFAEAGRPWNDMLYGQFVLRHPNHEDVLYDGYGVFRRLPGPVPCVDSERIKGVCVVRPDAEMRERLVRYLILNTHVLEQEAYAYGEDLEFEAFGSRCAEFGYERSRKVYLAVDEGRPLAALLAESGHEGANVFGLLNRCWIVMMEPEAARDDRVKLALLHQAIRHYAELGREDFLYFGHWGGEPMDLLEPLGYRFEAEGFRFLARREVLPAYMAYVDELMRMLRG
jgi:hypothetical protein